MNYQDIQQWFETSEIPPLDRHFADFMLELSQQKIPELYLASALVSWHAGRGDVCVELDTYASKELKFNEEEPDSFCVPDLESWISAIMECSVIGKPGERKPIIFDRHKNGCRLYLFRYWQYENHFAQYVKNNIQETKINQALLKEGLNRLFPALNTGEPDLQRQAADVALRHKFSVISGGPGTGKTTTVMKIIVLLLEQWGDQPFRLALVAPTGKAAARLKESIVKEKQALKERENYDDIFLNRIEEETGTIHRLLGNIRNSPYFRFHQENPLPYDCVIVDEASMVDLALMDKLTQALLPTTRLILLGDKDQLASVESGAVLGDLCSGIGQPDSQLGKATVHLTKSYRFDPEKGIGKISALINHPEGRAMECLRFLQAGKSQEAHWFQLPEVGLLKWKLKDKVLPIYHEYLEAKNHEEAFERFRQFSILCALRNGPYGALNINNLIEQLLIESGKIRSENRWYEGKPIMITRNDYNLKLFNGDIGLIRKDREDNYRLKAFFEKTGESSGQGTKGEYRKVIPSRLPEHETVFAMTVHKSQGSEFKKVLLMLSDQDNPVLTRELIYTGITRTRENIELWGKEQVFISGLNKKIRRISGLRDLLFPQELPERM